MAAPWKMTGTGHEFYNCDSQGASLNASFF